MKSIFKNYNMKTKVIISTKTVSDSKFNGLSGYIDAYININGTPKAIVVTDIGIESFFLSDLKVRNRDV